ncbi:hypothetical protein LWI29_028079 [Acer saccharum]|uniref:RNase H type-1 domain-containing protein n=1 Tax=Acer saccharum TaxID=4024 RepID=A0AA39RWJ2_ACESA|nr:hypothetical protein LWI29_028079 [Acer saccharum]
MVKWHPPEEGCWKINTDAATCYANRSIGLGIIIRNNLGVVKAAASIKLKAMVSPLVAEALAVWRGVILAVENGLVPFHIETDSLQVADLLNKGLVPHAEIRDARPLQ